MTEEGSEEQVGMDSRRLCRAVGKQEEVKEEDEGTEEEQETDNG